MLETAVLSDDWGQSLCGWMDIECSNSSVSTTISGDRAASGATRDGIIEPKPFWNICKVPSLSSNGLNV